MKFAQACPFLALLIMAWLISLSACTPNYKPNPGKGAQTYKRQDFEKDIDNLLLSKEEKQVGFRMFAVRGSLLLEEPAGAEKYTQFPLRVFTVQAPLLTNNVDKVMILDILKICYRHLEEIEKFREKYSKPFRIREENSDIALYELSNSLDSELTKQNEMWESLVQDYHE